MWIYFWLLFVIVFIIVVLFLVLNFFKDNNVDSPPEIILPGSDLYKKFNFGKRQPEIIFRPSNREKLGQILENLQKDGKKFFIVNKGYSKSTTSNIGIDLSLLSGIEILNNYVKVGPTTMIKDIFEKCLNNKLYFPFELSYLTIEEALILGISSTVRKYGFLNDNILEIEIILHDGIVQTINSDHPLFIPVLKTPPGTFGIIVGYNFRTFPFPNSILAFHYKYKTTDLNKILNWASARRRRRTTSDLTLTINIRKTGIEIKGIFFGNEDSLKRRLRDVSFEVEKEIEELSPYNMLNYIKKPIPSTFRKTKSHFGKEKLPDKISEIITKTLSELHLDIVLTFYLLPGPYLLVYKAEWDEYDEQETNIPWELDQIEALYQKIEPYVTNLSYLGFPDPTLSDHRKSYYGKDYTKISKLKKKFDPNSFFYEL